MQGDRAHAGHLLRAVITFVRGLAVCLRGRACCARTISHGGRILPARNSRLPVSDHFVIFVTMLFRIARQFAPSITSMLFAALMVSLFWCGNEGCFQIDGGRDSASIVCASSACDHTPEQQPVHNDESRCTCLCHMPTFPGQTAIQRTFIPSQPFYAMPGCNAVTSFSPVIDHPPTA